VESSTEREKAPEKSVQIEVRGTKNGKCSRMMNGGPEESRFERGGSGKKKNHFLEGPKTAEEKSYGPVSREDLLSW